MSSSYLLIRYIVLFAALFLFFILGLGSYDLSAPDEPRFALVAKEMIENGDYLILHRNERAYPDKPPLFFWTISATSLISGGEVNAWTARLPSALSALACLIIIARWSSKKLLKPESLYTIIVLGTCLRFMQQAHNAQIDMLLCLLVTSASILGFRHIQKEKTSQFMMGIVMGLAILTKGPVGYIIPAGALATYCALSRGVSWKDYPMKALAWGLLLPAAWLIGLTVEAVNTGNWSYLENLVFKQTIVRYADAWHHHKPFYYYLQTLLIDFFPWSLFLLGITPWTRQRIRSLTNKQKFAWCLLLFTLIFFSISKGKRDLYILPIYPFASFLLASYFSNVKKHEPAIRYISAASGILILSLGLLLIAIDRNMINIHFLATIEKPLPHLSIMGFAILICIGGLSTTVYSIAKTSARLPIGIIASLLCINLLYYQVLCPWINERRSARKFMESVNQVVKERGPDTKLAMIDFRSAYSLYGDRHIIELSPQSVTNESPKLIGLPSLADFWEKTPDAIVIARRKHLNESQSAKLAYREILHHYVSRDEFLLVENTRDAQRD